MSVGREKHLDLVRRLPCAACFFGFEVQQSATQAHHPIHGRYGTRRADDYDAIPLCEGHHQGLMDTTKVAIHREPSRWERIYGSDHHFIDWTRRMVEREEKGEE